MRFIPRIVSSFRLGRLFGGVCRHFSMDWVRLFYRSIDHSLVAPEQGRVHVAQSNLLGIALRLGAELELLPVVSA